MSEPWIIAIATVLISLINSTASVVMLYIRARYRWQNGARAVIDEGPHAGRD